MKKGIMAGACVLLAAAVANAAFILEVDIDGADDGVITFNPNFSFGGDTTAASQSAASTAYGMTGGDSIFGGNGNAQPDWYVYTYDPGTMPDNLAIPAGTDLGDGNTATGAVGGGPGKYTVYATWPFSANVSGGPTTYDVSTSGDSFSVQINQNGPGDTGLGNVWVKLGEISWTSGAITVDQKAGSNTYVSMRSAGLLFEAVPEPATLGLLGLAGLALLRRRR